MKVAFWNVNTGKNSFQTRLDTFENWCQAMQLDLLLLEEVGHTLIGDKKIETLTGMTAIGYVNTLDKNNNKTTKQIWALKNSSNSTFTAKTQTLRPPDPQQIRAGLKVTITGTKTFEIWVIHANASDKGGKAAVMHINELLMRPSGENLIIGGDLNCKIENAGTNAVRPHSWQSALQQPVPLNFTQWQRVDGAPTVGPNSYLHLTVNSLISYKAFNTHGIIDYVMKGKNQTVVPLPNCEDYTNSKGNIVRAEDTWIEILKNFDHCPVVYNFS